MKDFWNQRYGEQGFAYGTEANDFLRQEYHRFKPGGEILCIAEGEGRNALFLAAHSFQVTAMDQSEVGMQKAHLRATKEGLHLSTITADLENFDFGLGKWDAIVSIFGHLPPVLREEVHGKIVKALRLGGYFLMEAYTPEQLPLGTGGPKDINLMVTSEIIQKELSELSPEILQEVRRPIHEGKYHEGESAVIQFIGKQPL
jgi:SAM-dependent methyltransferase